MRKVVGSLIVVLLAVLLGCDSEKNAPLSAGSGKGISATDARKKLMDTATKMEGPFAPAVQILVEAVETGDVPWVFVDDDFRSGKFSRETIAAYEIWRAIKLAESKK